MFNIKQKIFFLCVILITNQSFAGELLCFQENKSGSNIKLRFILPDDNSNFGKVRYQNGSDYTNVILFKQEIVSPKQAIPAVIKMTFKEYVHRKNTGIYTLLIIGYHAPELVFKGGRKNKTIKFYEDNSRNDKNLDLCAWE